MSGGTVICAKKGCSNPAVVLDSNNKAACASCAVASIKKQESQPPIIEEKDA